MTNKVPPLDSSTNPDDDDRSDDGSIDIESLHESDHHDEEEGQSGTNDDTPKLATNENKAVSFFRILVLLALAATATAVSVFLYQYMRQDETDEFEAAAATHASKLIENFHAALEAKLSAINTLSLAITSYSLEQKAQGEPGLPFVTWPDFAVVAADTRVLAQALIIVFSPLVRQGEQRLAWEAYAEANRQHLMEKFLQERQQITREDARYNHSSLNLADFVANLPQPQKVDGVEVYPDGFHPHVHYVNKTTAPYDSEGWVMPLWDLSPSVPALNMINFDASRHFVGGGSVKAMYEHGAAVLDLAIGNLTDVYDTSGRLAMEYGLIASLGQYRYEPETQYTDDPLSAVVYPVFDRFDYNDRQVAGMLTTNIYWKMFFQNSLPDNARGIIVVLKNTFNQTFTYRVDGLNATYLGSGDLHDPSYDYLGQTAKMGDYIKKTVNPTTRSYTAAPLLGEYSDYTLHVYPSADTEDEYSTNEPVLYTLIVAGVFLITSTVFIGYDFFVARRQRLVMDNALRSGALISSLFPSNVRARLYEEAEQARKAKERASKAKKKRLTRANSLGEEKLWRVQESPVAKQRSSRDILNSSSLHNRGPAIADRFENSTVLFADLKGFTKWSSTRDPQAVFQLLETLYHSFDKIAEKRKVFKIETIGDCYVAVTGVPEPQADHAPRMVKFARNIMLKMRVLKMQLAETLGDDTIELDLRVGLHSGPVTAGVLRGKKSRFQLFGDTVNVAARMESNGMPGRIHMSEATAMALKERGYESWVQQREDTINAKGKGEMQTYWVVGSSCRSSSGYSGENSFSYTEDTSTRHLMNDGRGSTSDLLATDGINGDDDAFMLDLHEKLQNRMKNKKTLVHDVVMEESSAHAELISDNEPSES